MSIIRSAARSSPVVLALSAILVAQAAPGGPAVGERPAIRAKGTESRTYHLPLAQLAGATESLLLKGGAPELALALPLPHLVEPVEVMLTMEGDASRSLSDTSQLVVKVNGRIVDQLKLKSEDGRFKRSMAIPAHFLREGLNDVRLVAAQRSHPAQNSCDADAAPELWTQIDIDKTSFTIVARPRPVPARLDAMDMLFDPVSLQERHTLQLMTADVPTPGELKALAAAAQGLGRRHGDVPVMVRHGRFPANLRSLSSALEEGVRGALVVGTFDKVATYLDGLGLPADPGPVIALRPLPDDPTRFALVLAAKEEADLEMVAAAFAVPGVPWPDQTWLQIRDLDLPDTGPIQRIIEAPADPEVIFPLRALGYKTATFAGKSAPETSLRFWNNNWQGRVLVQVHLSYASGMAPQSALNVRANDVLHGSIPLNSPAGGSYFNYAVTVPAGSLKLGWNTLQFQPVLIPDGDGTECKTQDSLAVTLYDDTTVQKYEGAPSRQSDLALLAGLGRPYVDGKTAPDLAVHVGDTDSQTIGAGLTLLAKIAQVRHGPLQRVWFGTGEGPAVAHHLWVGEHESLPPALRRHAVHERQAGSVMIPLAETVRIPRPDGLEWYAALRDKLSFDGEDKPAYTNASLHVASSPGGKSHAYTERAGGVTTTVFTADDRGILAAGIASIVAPQQWHQLRGSYASWTAGKGGVSTISTDAAPFEAYGMRGGMAIVFSRHPWMALVALGLAIGLLVPVTSRVIKAYRRRNHGPHEQ